MAAGKLTIAKMDFALNGTIEDHQKRLSDAIERLEKDIITRFKVLETSPSGKFIGAKTNLKMAQKIHSDLTQLFDEQFGKEARKIIQEYSGIDTLLQESWKELGVDVNFTGLDKDLTEALRGTYYNEFLKLSEDAQSKIATSMYNSIAGQSSFQSLVDDISATLTGKYAKNGVPMTSYAKMFANDGIMNYHQVLALKKADDADMEDFLYVGNIMNTTRPFCREHVGKIYSREEIEGWNFPWAGKSGPALTHRGGYNCRHHWQPAFKKKDKKKEEPKGIEEKEPVSVPKPPKKEPTVPSGESVQAATESYALSMNELAQYGVKPGTKKAHFVEELINKPLTNQEIKDLSWNKSGNLFHDVFTPLKNKGLAGIDPDGKKWIKGPLAQSTELIEGKVVEKTATEKALDALNKSLREDPLDNFGSSSATGQYIKPYLIPAKAEPIDLINFQSEIKNVLQDFNFDKANLGLSGVVKELELKDLYGIESAAHVPSVKAQLKALDTLEALDSPPSTVVKYKDSYIIYSNQSYAEAQALLGEAKAEFHLIDLDEYLKKLDEIYTPQQKQALQQLKQATKYTEKGGFYLGSSSGKPYVKSGLLEVDKETAQKFQELAGNYEFGQILEYTTNETINLVNVKVLGKTLVKLDEVEELVKEGLTQPKMIIVNKFDGQYFMNAGDSSLLSKSQAYVSANIYFNQLEKTVAVADWDRLLAKAAKKAAKEVQEEVLGVNLKKAEEYIEKQPKFSFSGKPKDEGIFVKNPLYNDTIEAIEEADEEAYKLYKEISKDLDTSEALIFEEGGPADAFLSIKTLDLDDIQSAQEVVHIPDMKKAIEELPGTLFKQVKIVKYKGWNLTWGDEGYLAVKKVGGAKDADCLVFDLDSYLARKASREVDFSLSYAVHGEPPAEVKEQVESALKKLEAKELDDNGQFKHIFPEAEERLTDEVDNIIDSMPEEAAKKHTKVMEVPLSKTYSMYEPMVEKESVVEELINTVHKDEVLKNLDVYKYKGKYMPVESVAPFEAASFYGKPSLKANVLDVDEYVSELKAKSSPKIKTVDEVLEDIEENYTNIDFEDTYNTAFPAVGKSSWSILDEAGIGFASEAGSYSAQIDLSEIKTTLKTLNKEDVKGAVKLMAKKIAEESVDSMGITVMKYKDSYVPYGFQPQIEALKHLGYKGTIKVKVHDIDDYMGSDASSFVSDFEDYMEGAALKLTKTKGEALSDFDALMMSAEDWKSPLKHANMTQEDVVSKLTDEDKTKLLNNPVDDKIDYKNIEAIFDPIPVSVETYIDEFSQAGQNLLSGASSPIKVIKYKGKYLPYSQGEQAKLEALKLLGVEGKVPVKVMDMDKLLKDKADDIDLSELKLKTGPKKIKIEGDESSPTSIPAEEKIVPLKGEYGDVLGGFKHRDTVGAVEAEDIFKESTAHIQDIIGKNKELGKLLDESVKIKGLRFEPGAVISEFGDVHVTKYDLARNTIKVPIGISKTPKLTIGANSVGDDLYSGIRDSVGQHLYAQNRKIKDLWAEFHDNISFHDRDVWRKISLNASGGIDKAFSQSFSAYTSPLYKRGMLPKKVENFFDHVLNNKKANYLEEIKLDINRPTPVTFRGNEHQKEFQAYHDDYLRKIKEAGNTKEARKAAAKEIWEEEISPTWVQRSLNSWQGSTRNDEAMMLKFVAEIIEDKPVRTRITNHSSDKIARLYNRARKIAEGSEIKHYLRLRALNQAYFDATNTKTIKLWRGIGGRSGDAYKAKLEPRRAELESDVIIQEDSLTGYSSSKSVAQSFGRITVERDLDVREIIALDDIWPKNSFIREKETILFGGNYEVKMANILF